ncbi:hypothetical protein [Nonomuraea sp. bgisy101]|uniref:hypothetical protein n=1 Tax=Nonomuraea sp. bgisy101 TaxID=3413784 RepID=UPI003D715BA3
MKADDLTGAAQDLYQRWRDVGYSERQALEEVERSGVLFEQQLAGVFEAIGMNESTARLAAQGRDGAVSGQPFDEAVQAYQRMGLSPEAARTAAIGRHSDEQQARKLYAESARRPAPASNVVPLTERTGPGSLRAIAYPQVYGQDWKGGA